VNGNGKLRAARLASCATGWRARPFPRPRGIARAATIIARIPIRSAIVVTLAIGVPHLVRAQERASEPVVVASKPFGESYFLAELFAQLLESRGIAVERRPGLGATEIAFGALRTNAIDVYPEYTGTGLLAILHDSLTDAMRADPRATYSHVSRVFAERFGVRWLAPLGFQNGYAVAVRRETATQHSLRTLSDLARAGGTLTGGLTSDFIGRPDGLAGLSHTYGLKLKDVRPLAPAVKYTALAERAVDVIDGYSTDGLLAKYDLIALEDDRHFFPPYEAAALVSARVADGRPDVIAALSLLSGRLDEPAMRVYNRRIEVDREAIAAVAATALRDLGLVGDGRGATTASSAATPGGGATGSAPAVSPGAGTGDLAWYWARRAETARLALRHLELVAIALLAAILVAVPLAVALERARHTAEWVVGALGVLQTIPSIALLAFMIPLLGVGVAPALVALWLYALYPIARNTYTGVRDADPDAVQACEAMGATPWQRLVWVRLPLAAPVILAGVRTAAVITVGAATLAAFIGAGGLGDPIVTGLALADSRLVLSGAIPAALLAIAVDGILAAVERAVTPAHLRAGTAVRSS
jgi:osmoprotectant transport system permease protein